MVLSCMDINSAITLVFFQPEELRDIVEMSSKMEERYSHYFDYTIENDDLHMAATELITIAGQIEKTDQWVPVGWAL
ncbi:MAGUK p55 subfamily member 7 [Biomphalaria pfeifferi]|uniref:MAGUK p55 subfamily member 7 n=1 Tax=Biomphalaria pfeifferi TaxID=112525 RepID=A0AAD8C8C6_BIOPF|nr:MAGUK p55 subfamily member 7 [Biomphalaria pfeifferi]